MSPLSDTTNLAPAMAGGELFSHIKYMALTTVPTIIITLILFIIIGLSIDTSGTPQISDKLTAIREAFNISPWLFIVPVIVIGMIVKKHPRLSLYSLVLVGGIAAVIANQPL
jgi:NhaC family Na+:H+ antiporter